MSDSEDKRAKPPSARPSSPPSARPSSPPSARPSSPPSARPSNPPSTPLPNPPAAPISKPGGFMSRAKLSLTELALQLRDEQLEAKVVHYRADLATNAELDAVTAQVIADLQHLQAEAKRATPSTRPGPNVDRSRIELELAQNLAEMLGRIFRPEKLTTVVERKLGEVAKRFAHLFFESELADKIRGSSHEVKAMRFANQALLHALNRTESATFAHLESFQYIDPQVKDRAKDLYFVLVKNLRNDVLSRTTPELNVLVKYLDEVLSHFFMNVLPPQLRNVALEVVKEARLAEAKTTANYKISASSFPAFRQAFERRFLERLVPFTEQQMLTRIRNTSGQFREETLRLVAAPAVFSELCDVICDAVYDVLYNDGFLDLPPNWRARLSMPR